MKVRRLRWTAFRIPFREGFSAPGVESEYREGLIVRMTADEGHPGLGEISPLSEPEGCTFREAVSLLDQFGPALIGTDVDALPAALLAEASDIGPAPRAALAAVAAGLDIAACDATARAMGVPVARLLAPAFSPDVEINALVTAQPVSAARREAAEAVGRGFTSVKLKVGHAGREEDVARVRAVRSALGPDVRLRLDANGAWSVEEAIGIIDTVRGCDIEFVEQPVAPGNIEAMRQVRKSVPVPVAADEDIIGVDAAHRLIEAEAAQILVLKPMVVGGLRAARTIVEEARARGVTAVVTTTFDTGAGTAAALHLAATLPVGGPACGLATADVLESDLLAEPLAIREGRMSLPTEPGLGVEIDEAALARYRVSEGEAPR